ncbi:glycosyltransferase family 4 protein [Neptuniibacter pectenicola]|uniref:glycosyltransferase family 4 protein n=1 Tax=Neptuniibacter pectenicola TaxID=1806669 RepID=UPI0009EE82C5|nr:glycosyltransferase family 4 protein [Neptuniibacter pectenicola]
MNKNICFVTATSATVDAFLKGHINQLAKHNNVTVVTSLGETPLALPENVEQINIHISRKISIWSDIKSLICLWKLFFNSDFELVVSVTPKAGLLSMMAAFLCRVPVRIHWFTGQVWVTQSGWMRSLLKWCDKITALAATNILTDSQSQMEFIIKEGVTSEDKLQIIHQGSISGVDLDKFSPDAQQRCVAREEIGVGSNDTLFLFLGRLTQDKGVLDLAVAFQQLAKVENDVFLAFIGPDEDGLQQEILSICNDCSDKIYFKGFTDKPQYYFSAADVFVLPSYREGFGTSVIEAAAMSVPCIGSNIYGLSDAIIDKETGVLFPCQDTAELQHAMSRLAQNPDLRKTMGREARLRVQAEFSSELVTEKFVSYIHSKMGQ